MNEAVEYSDIRQAEGDDPGWSSPAYEDDHWGVVAFDRPLGIPRNRGILWLRFRVRSQSPSARLPSGVLIFAVAGSYELFWDGLHLGHSGTPGNSPATEREGTNVNLFSIPASSCGAGEHLVALRISTHHAKGPWDGTWVNLVMIDPDAFNASFRHDTVLPLISVGSLCTIALAGLVIWFLAGRRRVLLLLASTCFSGGLLVALKWYEQAYNYPYSWKYGLIMAVNGAALALSICLASVVLDEWSVPFRKRWLVLLSIAEVGWITATYPMFFALPALLCATAFGLILAFCVWAAWRKKHGAWCVGLGVCVAGAALWRDPVHFFVSDFFQDFMPAVLGLLFMIVLRLRAEHRAAQKARLTAARLEIELLKKNLQPHFLMNTLTALAQIIEENPNRAVKLIDDLAEEFRTLALISDQKTVTVGQELSLCRAHLRVMQARTDVGWELEVIGVDDNSLVPPALFLTLIENCFTHQRSAPGASRFSLKASNIGNRMSYCFYSPGVVGERTIGCSGGTGLRYIRARLQESFPGAWSLRQGAVEGGWETIIELWSDREYTPSR